MERSELVALIQRLAHPVRGLAHVRSVLQHVSHAHTVLLGEATHGTHEFYAVRAEITKALIANHGFDAVAVESDWPDALRVARYVQGAEGDDADHALGGYERFPRWMWRNTDVRDFVRWLRRHNEGVEPSQRVGFFGLDLYSLRDSIASVIRYLDAQDPEAARRARRRYACFDHFSEEPQRYGHATHFGLTEDCEDEVVRQLNDMLVAAGRTLRDGDTDERFYAQQNARVVANAERYYRTMFAGHNESWNLRDTHMAQTLNELRVHLQGKLHRAPRIVVWAHNSHIGDARATEPGDQGQITLGQLVRSASSSSRDCALVGFTTHAGTVAAASDWDEPVQRKRVRESRGDSIERVLHDTGIADFVLPLSGLVAEPLRRPMLERAIGVIYRPETERWSHYFHASLSAQFDVIVHLDETSAVTPLDPSDAWERHEEPETFPSGI